ncbi:hypothetical protein [Gymnodinialimonas ceratoperidinii]|uniref:Uncharacterized protein n=1 Tax=Gymnodinialimonas ceratoperidinii TaxID=2856823 RepID=A0A8F6TUF5_9RHOB|nr:hypothetical protein [Gymnodinialimonas ceratoperidinii]QXT39161.1 hypothetical protein KYE46_14705 [Gymnodinialimonas ceratoperidinii]
MTAPEGEVSLQDVIAVACDLRRAQWLVSEDGKDISNADNHRRDALRKAPLRTAWRMSLSLLEHGTNRALGRASARDLKPLLTHHLRALEGTEEAAPYGIDLARAVVEALEANLAPARHGGRSAQLANYHAGYCGIGLECREIDGKRSFHYDHPTRAISSRLT